MRIVGCKLRETHIPFKVEFAHATKTRSSVDGIIFEVITDSSVSGYGEALPRQYVTGETNQSVLTRMKNIIVPDLLGQEFNSFSYLVEWLRTFHMRYSDLQANELNVKTLAELALLDAYGRTRNKPLIDLVGGGNCDIIEYTGTVTAGKPTDIEEYLQAYQTIGFRQFKIKVGLNWQQDQENVQKVRKIFGPDAKIRIDANEAWDLRTAKARIEVLADLGVQCCEQPLPASSRQDYPELLQSIDKRMKLCVDESLCSQEDALWIAENKGAHIFNLRISKNGGILNTLEIAKVAKHAGIACQLGAQVGETSILTRAGQVVAEHLGNLIYHEGAFGTMLLDFDVTKKPIMFAQNGLFDCRPLRTRPGLGIDISHPYLERMTCHSTTFA